MHEISVHHPLHTWRAVALTLVDPLKPKEPGLELALGSQKVYLLRAHGF